MNHPYPPTVHAVIADGAPAQLVEDTVTTDSDDGIELVRRWRTAAGLTNGIDPLDAVHNRMTQALVRPLMEFDAPKADIVDAVRAAAAVVPAPDSAALSIDGAQVAGLAVTWRGHRVAACAWARRPSAPRPTPTPSSTCTFADTRRTHPKARREGAEPCAGMHL